MGFVTGSLGYILPFLIVLTVLVFVHELGHYLIARRAGVRVEVFSIGFGPELFGWFDRRGTRWRVSAVPFGGYVKMFGDADETSTQGADLSAMSAAERAVSFHHKPVGARAAITVAGPAANFIFAIVVYAALFMTVGQQYATTEISQVVPGSAAAAAGLQPHDRIVSIDGSSVDRFDDLVQAVGLNTGTPMHFIVERDGKDLSFVITPQMKNLTDRFGNHYRTGVLGVGSSNVKFIKRDPATAVWEATRETWMRSAAELEGLWQIIAGARTAEELGGPLRIAKLSGDVAQGGAIALISFMALLSVNLGLINLFPIPVLDGGHLLFYAAEAALGRPLGRRTQEFGFRLGLALVLTLMVFATWNDLVQLHVFSFLRGLVT